VVTTDLHKLLILFFNVSELPACSNQFVLPFS